MLRPTLPALAAALLLSACTSFSPGRNLQIASASVSQVLCSAVFVSRRDPEQTYRQEMRPQGGMGWIDWSVRYQVDRDKREVRTTVAGLFASRSVYREGMGCLIDHGQAPAGAAPAPEALPVLLPEIAGPAVVAPTDACLRAAIDEAFAEPPIPPAWQTKAVVVVHRCRGSVNATRPTSRPRRCGMDIR